VRWDEIFPTTDSVKSTVQEWLDNLLDWNGRQWYAQPISLVASSDALDFEYGGVVTLPDGSRVPVSGNLTEDEVKMSSTAREVIGFFKLLQATATLCPGVVKDSTIQLVGDNQAAVIAINQLRSKAADITKTLKEVFKLCIWSGFNVWAVLKPRDQLQEEDMLSRQPDAADWGIAPEVFNSICSKFGAKIAINLFASNVWHVTPRFVSLFYTPGCEVCRALLQDWRLPLNENEVAWIFPPVRIISDVVQLMERFRTNCVLLVPEQKAANWWVRLHALPLSGNIKQIAIPKGTGSCLASRRVPDQTPNPGLFQLRALLIKW
jgi:hypothetical protein